MQTRLATFIAAAFLIGSACTADAADLGAESGGAFTDCNCGSDMIVIYDSEPGVITRNWKSDCDCRYARDPHRAYRMAAPRVQRYESLRDPWRR